MTAGDAFKGQSFELVNPRLNSRLRNLTSCGVKWDLSILVVYTHAEVRRNASGSPDSEDYKDCEGVSLVGSTPVSPVPRQLEKAQDVAWTSNRARVL